MDFSDESSYSDYTERRVYLASLKYLHATVADCSFINAKYVRNALYVPLLGFYIVGSVFFTQSIMYLVLIISTNHHML